MASLIFKSSAQMLHTRSWTAETVHTEAGSSGSEIWLLDESLPANTASSSRDQSVERLRAGADGAIAISDGAGNITSVSVFSEDQSPLPDSNLWPYAYKVNEFSLPYATFMSYFKTGDEAGFLTEVLAGDDFVLGSPFNDVIVSYAGADLIRGYGGNDTLIGHEGSDTLDGGYGNDLLIGDTSSSNYIDYADYRSYAATLSDYSVTLNASGNWIVQRISDLDIWDTGTDTLYGVERLIFHDANLALDVTGTPAQAYRIYRAAFDRAPDMAGLGFWIDALDRGASPVQMAQGFVQSAEFRSLYGSDPSNAEFVDRLYLNVLDRPGESAGRDFWIGALDRGASRADVLLQFSESTENINNVRPLIEDGIAYLPWAV